MKKHHIRIGCMLIFVLICFVPLFMLNANGITSCDNCGQKNPQWLKAGDVYSCGNCGAQYKTICINCGQDNPQWLQEDSVNYCSKCGALGLHQYIGFGSGTKPDNTGSYDPSTDGDADIPVAVVIGTGAAVTIIAVSMARRKKKPGSMAQTKNASSTSQKPQQKKPEEEQPAGYILQLSQDNIVLEDREEEVVGIRVLRVDDNAQTTIASNAEIIVQPQKDSRLLVIPARGMGVLNVKILQNGAVQQDVQEAVQVTATVPGKTLVTTINVMLKAGWKMVFR